jgi:hypothetical protein
MKKLLIAALLAAGPAMADLVATNKGGDELRLMPGRCVHGGILGHLAEEWRPKFKKGQAWIGGKLHFVCWIDTGDGDYFVMGESGASHFYPITMFIEQPGV